MYQRDHPERSTAEYAAILTDGRPTAAYPTLPGTPLPLASIVLLQLVSLRDAEQCVDEDHPLELIDGRQNITLIGGGIVQPATSGLYCTYATARLDPMDASSPLVPWLRVSFPLACQQIRVAGRKEELHIATFHLQHSTGEHNWEVGINVRDLAGIG